MMVNDSCFTTNLHTIWQQEDHLGRAMVCCHCNIVTNKAYLMDGVNETWLTSNRLFFPCFWDCIHVYKYVCTMPTSSSHTFITSNARVICFTLLAWDCNCYLCVGQALTYELHLCSNNESIPFILITSICIISEQNTKFPAIWMAEQLHSLHYAVNI